MLATSKPLTLTTTAGAISTVRCQMRLPNVSCHPLQPLSPFPAGASYQPHTCQGIAPWPGSSDYVPMLLFPIPRRAKADPKAIASGATYSTTNVHTERINNGFPITQSSMCLDPNLNTGSATGGSCVLKVAGAWTETKVTVNTTKFSNGPHRMVWRADAAIPVKATFSNTRWTTSYPHPGLTSSTLMIMPFTVAN